MVQVFYHKQTVVVGYSLKPSFLAIRDTIYEQNVKNVGPSIEPRSDLKLCSFSSEKKIV